MQLKEITKIIKNHRRWIILLESILATIVLLAIVEKPFIATKIVGVDNFNARFFYYQIQSDKKISQNIVSCSDSIVVYQPFTQDVFDLRRLLASELNYVCQFHPKAIIFDYVFEEEYDFTSESDKLLIAAINNCLTSGVKFYAPYINQDKVRVNFFHKYISVAKGSVYIPDGRIDGNSEIDGNSWMPALALDRRHTSSFYKNRGIDFTTPDQILQANHDSIYYSREKLNELLNGKYVIFSDTRDRADLKKMPFPTKDLQDNKNYLTGAVQLWYAMRSEICNRWDFYLPDYIAFLYALLIGYLYLHWQDSIYKRYRNGLVTRFAQFGSFIITEVILIPLTGLFFMLFHWVMPLAESAIIIVFV